MANPVLNEKFLSYDRVLDGEPMTINGSINKTLILLALVIVGAAYTWSLLSAGFTDKVEMLMIGGIIVAFIAAMVGIFTTSSAMRKGESPKAIIYAAPVYGLAEGLALGGISAMFEASYPGIVIQAVAGTFAALFAMLFLYRTGIIKATEKFRSVLIIAMSAILILYLINFVLLFFSKYVPIIYSSSNAGIAFSVVVIVVAALNFIIDFDFIERASENLMPKNCEWYGALGLMLTLVWLYIEILRLLAKLNSRR